VFGLGVTLGLVLPLDRFRADVASPHDPDRQPRPLAAPAPSAAVVVSGQDSVAAYVAAIKNFRAAAAAHDEMLAARFRRQIDAITTPAFAADVFARDQELRANISTAASQHDARLRYAFEAQLNVLCSPPGFLAQLPGCRPAAR
jgi:hypothetical protein